MLALSHKTCFTLLPLRELRMVGLQKLPHLTPINCAHGLFRRKLHSASVASSSFYSLLNWTFFDALHFDVVSRVYLYYPYHNRILKPFRNLNTASIKNTDLSTKCILYLLGI